MARRTWLLMGALAAGCSDAPREFIPAKRLDPPPATKLGLPAGPPPAASDPAAAAVVKAAVAAHTGGDPGKLGQLSAAKGRWLGAIVRQQRPLYFDVSADGPDRYRVDSLDVAGQPELTLCRNADRLWRAVGGGAAGPVDEVERPGMLADTRCERLLFLAPLADPGLIAAPAADATVGDRPAVGVWLSGPALPSVVAHFDKESKLLVRFAYQGNESGKAVAKQVGVLAHREMNGVRLPHKLAVRWDGVLAFEWTVDKVDFPVTFPAGHFDKP